MAPYKDGLTTAHHDKMDVEAFFARVYEAAEKYKGGTIADLFSGGGRDILAFHKRLGGNGNFAAIDTDPQRLVDMLKKGPLFQIAANAEGLATCFNHSNIAVIQGSFPDKPFGDSDINLKADFALCNAGIMFIKPEYLPQTLAVMENMLNEGGELALRFSLEREDKKEATGKTYFVHAPEQVRSLLEEYGLKVTRHPDLPDPERDFCWVDLEAVKPAP